MSPLALIRWMISSPVHIRATGRARGTMCVRGQYVREVASIACPATGGHHPGYTVTELSSFARCWLQLYPFLGASVVSRVT